jgi:DNA ligase-1
MRDLLARSDPLTAKYIVKVLGGELRIGLREGLVEAAIAKAFDRPLDEVKWAGMLTGDVGALATPAREGRLDEARASRSSTRSSSCSPRRPRMPPKILRRLGQRVGRGQYDRDRAQLHQIGPEVRLYSRDLHDISGQFPEVVSAAADLPWDGILDGEILAYRAGAVLPFIALQARLGRKSPSAAILEEIPVIYVAFDVLGLDTDGDGRFEALLRDPLTERRRQLDALDLPPADEGGGFAQSHLIRVDSIDSLEDAFAAARAQRNSLMVGSPERLLAGAARGSAG